MFDHGKEIIDASSRARLTSVSHGTMSSLSIGRVAGQRQGVLTAASSRDVDKWGVVKLGGFTVFSRFCYRSVFAACLPLGIGKQNNPWRIQGLIRIGGETGNQNLGF
jgi:hypothetical protein